MRGGGGGEGGRGRERGKERDVRGRGGRNGVNGRGKGVRRWIKKPKRESEGRVEEGKREKMGGKERG